MKSNLTPTQRNTKRGGKKSSIHSVDVCCAVLCLRHNLNAFIPEIPEILSSLKITRAIDKPDAEMSESPKSKLHE